jgi:hypothetical protein
MRRPAKNFLRRARKGARSCYEPRLKGAVKNIDDVGQADLVAG